MSELFTRSTAQKFTDAVTKCNIYTDDPVITMHNAHDKYTIIDDRQGCTITYTITINTSTRMRTESNILINVQCITSPLTLGGIVVTATLRWASLMV